MRFVPFGDLQALKQHAQNAWVDFPRSVLKAYQIVLETSDPNDTPADRMHEFARAKAPTADVIFSDGRDAVFAVWFMAT